MRIDLEQLDVRGMMLGLPSQRRPQGVAIREALALAGKLEQHGAKLTLSDVAAREVLLEALTLVFGAVAIGEQGEAKLEQVRLNMEQDDSHISLELHAGTLLAERLRIEVAGTCIQGAVDASDVRLVVRDQHGFIEAAQATFRGLGVEGDALRAQSPELHVDGFHVSWDEHGAGFDGRLVALSRLELSQDTMRLSGSELMLHELSYGVSGLSLRKGTLASAALEQSFERSTGEDTGARETTSPRSSLFDLRLLDALSGTVEADVDVALAVPVIGQRKATHKLRLAIENGVIDYRQLESGLALLENALLNFVVRDGALEIELAVPLMPRGHGKPLIRWPLGADDLVLAEQRRVRLAVLPNYERNGASREESGQPADSGSSSVSLKELGIENVALALSLAPSGQLLSPIEALALQQLTLQGAVRYEPSGKPPGVLGGGLKGLEARLSELPLGSRRASIGRLALGSSPELKLFFTGLSPGVLSLEILELELSDLALQNEPSANVGKPSARTEPVAASDGHSRA